MVRAHRASSFADATWRLLTPLLAVVLALTFGAASPEPVAAGGDVAAIRAAQRRAEDAMRRADQQIVRLQKQRRNHEQLFRVAKKQLKKSIRQRDKVEAKLAKTEQRLKTKRQILGRALRVSPRPAGKQVVDKPALRKQVRKLQAEVDRLQKKTRVLSKKVDRARDLKQARAKKVSKARIAARVAERERAEDKLGSRISQMLELSQQRAAAGFSTSSVRGFAKPAKGTVSQPYGCTGYVANPRLGSCAHFHDGVDIAAVRGTAVRAAASGYVAYVGFNPWDTGSRSFVVIIGHAGGYETIYAHLQATRLVKAGQRVKRGDVIGRIGMTGHTSGPHVHWEVSRDFRTLNPFRAGR